MGRYANPQIRLDFPDLSEDDDPIYVTIRNPKNVPGPQLMTNDLPEGSTSDQYLDESYRIMAGLVVDWHVYDGASDDGDALPLPASVESMRKLPVDITKQIAEQIALVVNPPQ